MYKSVLSLFLALFLAVASTAQITINKDGKEFFNGDERHLYAYLNNNYHELDIQSTNTTPCHLLATLTPNGSCRMAKECAF